MTTKIKLQQGLLIKITLSILALSLGFQPTAWAQQQYNQSRYNNYQQPTYYNQHNYPYNQRSEFYDLKASLDALNTKVSTSNSYFVLATNYLKALPQLLQDAIGNVMTRTTDLMFEDVPGMAGTTAASASIGSIMRQQDDSTKQKETDLENNFSGVNLDTKKERNSDFFDYKQRLEGAYASITTTIPDGKSNISSLSAGNFIAPTKYDTSEAMAAQNYLMLASGSALPLKKTPYNLFNVGDEDNDNKMEYNNEYNTLAAIQSLSTYNLSQVYAERVGVKINPESDDTHTISSAQLFQYLAMHKATDPNWYKQMATVSPFTSIRELLNFSAGSFMALYRIEQTQEQILATLSETNTLLIMQEKRALGQ